MHDNYIYRFFRFYSHPVAFAAPWAFPCLLLIRNRREINADSSRSLIIPKKNGSAVSRRRSLLNISYCLFLIKYMIADYQAFPSVVAAEMGQVSHIGHS